MKTIVNHKGTKITIEAAHNISVSESQIVIDLVKTITTPYIPKAKTKKSKARKYMTKSRATSILRAPSKHSKSLVSKAKMKLKP
jgi:uncharacterized membrane protein